MAKWTVDQNDFAAIEQWGSSQNPLAAVDDYSDLKKELRWLNPAHRQAHDDYVAARLDYIQNKDFDNYYKTAEKPIDKERWEFLKQRKAWFTCPLGWERFAESGVSKILDLGCGDGDVTQGIADFVAATWKKNGYEGHALEIVGLDLNPSRIDNARNHCQSPHNKITFSFDTTNAVDGDVPLENKSFDYVACTGVFEILADAPAKKFLSEICRLALKGIYIEDLFDEYPGGFPRTEISAWINEFGFKVTDHEDVFSEPFTLEGSRDPKQLRPILVTQLIFATA